MRCNWRGGGEGAVRGRQSAAKRLRALSGRNRIGEGTGIICIVTVTTAISQLDGRRLAKLSIDFGVLLFLEWSNADNLVTRDLTRILFVVAITLCILLSMSRRHISLIRILFQRRCRVRPLVHLAHNWSACRWAPCELGRIIPRGGRVNVGDISWLFGVIRPSPVVVLCHRSRIAGTHIRTGYSQGIASANNRRRRWVIRQNHRLTHE